MKLGLITDVHEHVEFLTSALDRFESERVDQIVMIGDVFEMSRRIEETCRLLADADVIGVWGNHDFGICVEPDAYVFKKYSETVLNFMRSLRPRLEIEGCYFTHIEPWLNPEKLADLWYFDGPPYEQRSLDRIFNAVTHRLLFAGHYHQWLLATPDEIQDWKGDTPVRLNEGRYFVIVGALCEGSYAILDTESWELRPFNEGESDLK